jgi:ABC-type transporter Mla subunit MlaD
MTELESLVGDLRKQVDTIDSANVLSMDLIHKAEEIEKLARQIKTLARGV